ncbi:DUF6839 family protein [Mastigocoleus testarum]|uniref:DUF6839 domain-containing protein n=1 Tax=Mastigocoleus testarum BC008 TaxID=371196 RepID=A0A0V7ZG64_9CYAN|nr:hypothetical protein [Mastigocoleus testarum]KST63502.1 hypothetical protein BC008_13645 [Mastigocoleus testarum BC008]
MNHYARDLQGEQYQLLQDSQDMDAVIEHIGIKQHDCGFLIVNVGDGEYKEVYSSVRGAMPTARYALVPRV